MVATQPNLDAAFSALSDPTRRAILARLARGEATVMQLAEPFAMSQPAISRHLKVLQGAGLITRRVEGTKRPCRLEPRRLAQTGAWIDQLREFWETSFKRLEAVLDMEMRKKQKRGPRIDNKE